MEKQSKIKYKQLSLITLWILNVNCLIGSLNFIKNLYLEFYWHLTKYFYLWVVMFILIMLWITYLAFRRSDKIIKLRYQAVLVVLFTLINIWMFALSQVKVEIEVINPAPPFKVEDTLEIQDGSSNFYLTGVYTKKSTSLLGKYFVMLDRHFDLMDNSTQTNDEDEVLKGQIAKDASIEAAILAAYQAANFPIAYRFHGMIVASKLDYASKQIQIGDIITHINDIAFTSEEEFFTVYQSLRNNLNDDQNIIKLTILRNNVEFTLDLPLVKIGNTYNLGIGLYSKYQINSSTIVQPKNHSSFGPSGGLMMSLAIYDALTQENLSFALRITGTGTINFDGTVGEIGGIKQKILAASAQGFHYFFVPAGGINETDAQAIMKELHTSMKIVPVNTLNEAIAFLRGLHEKNN